MEKRKDETVATENWQKLRKLTENCSDVRKVITIYFNIIYGRMMYKD